MITVKDILDNKGYQVWTVSPDDTVLDALNLMADKGIGAVVVVDNGAVVGILSERDYARKIRLQDRTSRDTKAKEIMSTQVYSVLLTTRAEECMGIMSSKRLRHLPVIAGGELRGIVSIGDIVQSIIREQEITIADLEGYITGKYIR